MQALALLLAPLLRHTLADGRIDATFLLETDKSITIYIQTLMYIFAIVNKQAVLQKSK